MLTFYLRFIGHLYIFYIYIYHNPLNVNVQYRRKVLIKKEICNYRSRCKYNIKKKLKLKLSLVSDGWPGQTDDGELSTVDCSI